MHTQIQIPRAVQDISRSRLHVRMRSGTRGWLKSHAHRRQRRYINQLMDKLRLDPELYDGEGFRGIPGPLTTWDID